MEAQFDAVYKAYKMCPEYKLAVDTWCAEIMRGGIAEGDVVSIGISKFDDIVISVIRQLVLVGFAVLDKKTLCVKPRAVLNWNHQDATWISPSEDDMVCIVSAPVGFSSDCGTGHLLTSPGASALPIYEQLSALNANHRQRDAFNSTPAMYTTPNPQLSTGDLVTPSFIAPRSSGRNAPDPDETTVGRRYELLMALQHKTSELRRYSRAPLMAGGGFPEAQHASVHTEYMLTDGQVSASEARHLSSSVSDHVRLFSKLRQVLLQTLGVPPQVLGENVNSERLAGSSEITDQAVRLHALQVARYRDSINTLMEPTGYTIRPFVPEADVIRYASMFRPEIHRELFASAVGVPVQFLVDDTRGMSQAIDPKKSVTERGDPMSM